MKARVFQDRWLVGLLIPLWLLCFVLHLHREATTRIRWVDAYVTAGPEPGSHPVVSGRWPGDGDEEVRPGDVILRVGDADLAGAGPLRFFTAAHAGMGPDGRTPLVLRRGGRVEETSIELPPPLPRGWILPVVLSFAVSAVLVLASARGSPMARLYFLAALSCSFFFMAFPGGREPITRFWLVVASLGASLCFPLSLRAFLSVPERLAPHGVVLWLTWVFALFAPAMLSTYAGTPFAPAQGARLAGGLSLVYAAILVGGIAWNYRRADPAGRRQLKWILYGFAVGLVPPMVGIALFLAGQIDWFSTMACMLSVALLPISVLVGISRYNLFDIDRVISGTASYAILVVLLAFVGEELVEPLAGWAADRVGFDRDLGQVIFVVMVAAALVPAQRSWRPHVDRIFYASKRALEERVEALLHAFDRAGTRREVLEQATAGLEELFAPEFCAIYERGPDAFQPASPPGPASPSLPPLQDDVGWLERRVGPVLLDRRGASSGPAPVTALPEAAVAVPLRPTGALDGFLLLGRKRSGDVYTPTDLTLLASIGHELSRAQAKLAA